MGERFSDPLDDAETFRIDFDNNVARNWSQAQESDRNPRPVYGTVENYPIGLAKN